jgi:ribonuclease HII
MISTANLSHEYRLRADGFVYIAGVDEAGRGAWAGPVMAGAVILPLERFDLAHVLADVNDSKLLTPALREALLPRIMATAVAVGVGYATNEEIDRLGIVPASKLAMQRALGALKVPADTLLLDSVPLPEARLPYTALIKGDQRSLSIAAASIVAKVVRDQFMERLHDLYPQYGFGEHKGYGTALHRQVLQHFGPCAVHRMSFAPVKMALDAHQRG